MFHNYITIRVAITVDSVATVPLVLSLSSSINSTRAKVCKHWGNGRTTEIESQHRCWWQIFIFADSISALRRQSLPKLARLLLTNSFFPLPVHCVSTAAQSLVITAFLPSSSFWVSTKQRELTQLLMHWCTVPCTVLLFLTKKLLN